jgi:UDP-N-acetylmuramate--alanine ligase
MKIETTQLQRIYKRVQKFLTDPGEVFLVQSIEEQCLYICEKDVIVDRYDSSSSRFGVGIREDSLKTPPGIHRIIEKIGAGAPLGSIFKDRLDTGNSWERGWTDEDLMLTRILRLEGLEQGINKGIGVDSYERCIYIHGTNHEERVGTPLSHGCLALRNADIIRLFERVREGTLILIDPLPVTIDGTPCRNVHFTGIFGTGMSALAQYLRFQGIVVSGSDRLLDSEDTASMRRSLEELGCTIVSQDGSGVSADTDAVCISTAIEESNTDIAAARAYGIPVVHRSDVLAALIEEKQTIAVAGTSGKSTVTSMIFEFLTACGKSPSLISGAPLQRLERQGLIGNAWSGGSNLLVVEADESDGTIVKYFPDATVVLNISKDHKGIDEIKELFISLISQSTWAAVNSEDPILVSFPATVSFGRNISASWRSDFEEVLPTSVKLLREGFEYHLPLPGEHNLENLRAALCVCEHFGCGGSILASAVKDFEGVARRFCVTKTKQNIFVVDDYAHNPAKIAAVVKASRGLSDRIIAVYQPHGFGPTRFLKDEYIATFRNVFRQCDILYLLPIYYAGGTAEKNIASEDIIHGLDSVSFNAEAVKDRNALMSRLKVNVSSGDCILVMGARDPSLPALVRKIVALFSP